LSTNLSLASVFFSTFTFKDACRRVCQKGTGLVKVQCHVREHFSPHLTDVIDMPEIHDRRNRRLSMMPSKNDEFRRNENIDKQIKHSMRNSSYSNLQKKKARNPTRSSVYFSASHIYPYIVARRTKVQTGSDVSGLTLVSQFSFY
jgi:hypothetical protein